MSLDHYTAHRVCKTPNCFAAVYRVGKEYCFYCDKKRRGFFKDPIPKSVAYYKGTGKGDHYAGK